MDEKNKDLTLQRRLGLFPLTNIVVANMVGAGIFTTSGLLMRDLADPIIMIALWVVGGIIAVCGALSYGQLGAAMPEAGGEYIFLTKLFHPVLGFLTGWTSFVVGFSAPIAASSIGFSEYLNRAFPDLFEWMAMPFLPLEPQRIVAVIIILLFSFVHMRGIEIGARVQNYLTVMKVGLILAVVAAGLAFGSGDVTHFRAPSSFSFDFAGWKTLGLSLMWIMFAYSGWNASTYLGAEVKDPSMNLPRSLLAGTGIVLALYVGLNVMLVYALSPADMSGVLSVVGMAMGSLFGSEMETIASVLISFALFSSLSAFIMLGPRVYYAMARDRVFFRSISYVHPRFEVPTRSIALQGMLAVVMVLSGTFDQILTFMGFALGIFPIAAVLGVYRLKPEIRPHLGLRLAPVIYIVAGFCMLTLAFLQRPFESSIALGTVACGIPLYYIFKRKSGYS
ncbi:MAG: amino acid permease [Ignavibacteriales bacterium]|nr:amino acid permease [Ignavibacteriales bacterium]